LRGASIFWFLFSSGGIVVSLLAGVLWLCARHKSRGPRVFLVFIAVGYALVSVYPVPRLVEQWMGAGFRPLARADVPPGRTVVVLLGSGSYRRQDWSDEKISVLDPIGAERTLEAARVYRLINPDFVISSGGVIDPEQPEDPAGQTMKDALVRLGVPADRIIVEGESRNTREEALTIAQMLPAIGTKHVVLVTSSIHMRRAVGMFRAAGVEVIPAISRQREYTDSILSFVPTEAGLRLSALAVHELAGLTYYRLKGWYK
jgi:uncharacterized SAM-binding protein YcdF (DUF218 family)